MALGGGSRHYTRQMLTVFFSRCADLGQPCLQGQPSSPALLARLIEVNLPRPRDRSDNDFVAMRRRLMAEFGLCTPLQDTGAREGH